MPTEITWIGNDRIRSLLIKKGKDLTFYFSGQVVPAGVLSPEVLARYAADGIVKIKSVIKQPVTVANTEQQRQIPDEVQPQKVEVQRHSIAVQDESKFIKKQSFDELTEEPDSAVRRTRKSSKRKK